MMPNLLSLDLPLLGRVDFPAYFTLLLLGFLLAVVITQREASRRGIDPNHVVDLGIWVLVAGLLGSRFLHIVADGYFMNYVHHCTDPSLVDWGYNQAECTRYQWVWNASTHTCTPPEADCLLALKFWKGGLTFYGGLLGAIPVGIYFFRSRKIRLGDGVDMGSLGVLVGLGVGRLGCFLAGCCFGKLCDLPWAVSFPAGSEASKQQAQTAGYLANLFPDSASTIYFSKNLPSLPVHPTQLYETLACFLILAYLYFYKRFHQRFVGELFWMFLFLCGLERFGIEFWRDDPRGGFAGLATSQWIGLGMMCVALPVLALSGRRKKEASSKP